MKRFYAFGMNCDFKILFSWSNKKKNWHSCLNQIKFEIFQASLESRGFHVWEEKSSFITATVFNESITNKACQNIELIKWFKFSCDWKKILFDGMRFVCHITRSSDKFICPFRLFACFVSASSKQILLSVMQKFDKEKLFFALIRR